MVCRHYYTCIGNLSVDIYGETQNEKVTTFDCHTHFCQHLRFYPQVWFQNRRAKYRKQEKQLAKSLSPVIPSCNSMMRNIYPSNTRPYGTYPSPGGMNNMARYPQMNTSYSPVAQFPSMNTMQSNMAASMPRQIQQFPSMASDYNLVRLLAVALCKMRLDLISILPKFWNYFDRNSYGHNFGGFRVWALHICLTQFKSMQCVNLYCFLA